MADPTFYLSLTGIKNYDVELPEAISSKPKALKFSPLSEDSPKIEFIDVSRYSELQKQKDNFDDPRFKVARDYTYEFERLGNSIFSTRAAVKLANIDAIYHLTGDDIQYDKFQSDSEYTFVDIASGPGSFTQYLQWRLPKSYGYGMTLKGPLDWNAKIIDADRFEMIYGKSGTGDLYLEFEYFINYVNKNAGKVDLVVGDGGFDTETGLMQEFASSRLLLIQCLIGIALTRPGGFFVVKVFDTITLISAQVIYLLSQAFDEVVIFKPLSSRPANAERYLICRSRNESDSSTKILMQAANEYSLRSKMLTRIFENDLPKEFVKWLLNQNELSITRQEIATQKILDKMSGKEVQISEVDLMIPFILWNIPDNIK